MIPAMGSPLQRVSRDEDCQSGAFPTRSTSINYNAPRVSMTLADFDIVRRIGDGSFSEVMQVRLKSSGQDYALKMVDKHLIVRHKMVDHIKLERNILDQCNCPGIAKLYFTFQDEASLYLGLELCQNGELYDQIRVAGRLSVERARVYAAEILLMLQYLQAQQVVHRDLKPENLLLDAEGHLKLVDFGSALLLQGGQAPERDAGSQRKTSLVGTADYVAPEVLSNDSVTSAVDLWALGCIIFQMLVGKAPFKAASEYLTFQRIADGLYTIPPDSQLPEAAVDIIHRLLVVDPAARLGTGEAGLQEVKAHPFFEGIEWDTLREQQAPAFAKPQTLSDLDAVGLDWELTSLANALPVQYSYDGVQGLQRCRSAQSKGSPCKTKSSLSLSSQPKHDTVPAPDEAADCDAALAKNTAAADGGNGKLERTASETSSGSWSPSKRRVPSVRRLSPFADDACQVEDGIQSLTQEHSQNGSSV